MAKVKTIVNCTKCGKVCKIDRESWNKIKAAGTVFTCPSCADKAALAEDAVERFHLTAFLNEKSAFVACFSAKDVDMAGVIARTFTKSWEHATMGKTTHIRRKILRLSKGLRSVSTPTHKLCLKNTVLALFWAPNDNCATEIARKLKRTYCAKKHTSFDANELRLKHA